MNAFIVTNTSDSRAAVDELDVFELEGVPEEVPGLLVTTAEDVVDPFDGETSLREAILFANSRPEADTILFHEDLAGATIRLAETLPTITEALTIAGGPAGVTITGDVAGNDHLVAGTSITDLAASRSADVLDDNVRLFDATAPLTLDKLILTGGRTTASGVDGGGGAVRATADLTLTNSTVSGNTAGGPGGGIYGGFASVTLTNSTVSGNTAAGNGGGIDGYRYVTLTNSTVSGNTAGGSGGGIYGEFASVMLTNSTVSGNTAGRYGGGAVAYGGTVTLTNSTVSGNTAAGSVGGIYGLGIVMTNSTVSGNTAAFHGGGIIGYFVDMVSNSTVSGNTAGGPGGGILGTHVALTNSTVSGNTAEGSGGGIWGYYGVRLTNSTVSGNAVAADGASGGGIYSRFGLFTLTNSLVLGNWAAKPSDQEIGFGPYSLGYTGIKGMGLNLVGANEAAFAPIGATILNADPTLVFAQTTDIGGGVLAGVLANNGGPTQTIALRAALDNPALNAGDSTLAPGPFDQRGEGFDRVVGDAVDLGAFEVQEVLLPPPPPGEPTTIGFRVLPVDTNGEAQGGPLVPGTAINEIDPSWILPRNGVTFQQLLALVDSEPESATPAFGDGFDRGFNLASMAGNDRVRSLLEDNGEDDPVQITATGRAGPSAVGDLTAEVRFSNDRGFGLKSHADRGPDHGFLNQGEAIDFAVAGQLREASFTVQLRDTSQTTTLALDVDGDTMANPSGQRNRFETDALVELAGLGNGSRVEIDFVEEQLRVDGQARSGIDTGFWGAFAEGGADNITIGTRHDETDSFAIADLLLIVDDPTLL